MLRAISQFNQRYPIGVSPGASLKRSDKVEWAVNVVDAAERSDNFAPAPDSALQRCFLNCARPGALA